VEAFRLEKAREIYAALFETEKDLYPYRRVYEDTAKIVEFDGVRDELFLFLKRTIKSNQKSPDANRRKAAADLMFHIHKFRNANRQSYSTNSAQVNAVVQLLSMEENSPHLSLLGLSDVVPLLEKANNDFEDVYNHRSSERLTRIEAGKLKDARLKVDEAYRRTAEILNAMYQMHEISPFEAEKGELIEEAILSINGFISQLKETVGLRKARRASAASTPLSDRVSGR
jgi:hypothetical protein